MPSFVLLNQNTTYTCDIPLQIGISLQFNSAMDLKLTNEGQTSSLLLTLGAQGRIQDLIRGGPDRDKPKLPMVCSSVVQVKRALFSVGSGAHLRAPEALGYFITKCAFSPFWGTILYYF